MFNFVNMATFKSLISHEKYQTFLSNLGKIELDRIYCKHDISHFLDVARIMYILKLENNLNFDKETLYITAFFHDIGRAIDKSGNDHALLSQRILTEIVAECQIDLPNIDIILNAIGQHRIENTQSGKLQLSNLFFTADKLSRNCFDCMANSQCNWTDNSKNLGIKM